MTNIELSVLEIINQFRKTHSNAKELEEMELSIKAYQKMIDNGITKPRGYSIRTINDMITSLKFNH